MPRAWHGFLLISDHALKGELNAIHRAGLLTINTSQYESLTFSQLSVIDPNLSITYLPVFPADGMSEAHFLYLLDMRNKGTPAIMNATFMIAILLKQASQDASIRPYYTALRYLYIYVWAIVVVRSVLTLF